MPVWTYNIDLRDVKDNAAMGFEEKRDTVVDRLRASSWHTNNALNGGELCDLLDALADAEDGETFDEVMEEIYDIADEERAWIATF